jgi:ElaB/YqjD/DUF883 family membrane-anchored ribosome-binding protein
MATRSWLAVSTWFRSGAGKILSKKEKKAKNETRAFKQHIRDVLSEVEEELSDNSNESTEPSVPQGS